MFWHDTIRVGLLFLQLIHFSVCNDDLLTILPAKDNQTKFVGEAFFVGCESSGKNVQRVMWTGPDGKQITNYLQRIHVEDGKLGHKGADLVFEEIERKDRGKYSCSASVDGQEVQKSFLLDVFKPISFAETEKVQFLEEGSDSPIRCNVDGDPKPTVNWRYNQTKVTPQNKNTSAKYTNHPENSAWLVVKNASISDKGNYTCVALQLSTSTSKLKMLTIDVKVRHRPMENSSSRHVNESYSYLSGVVNLTCEVIAEPSANFTWIKDGEKVETSEEIKIFNEDQRSTLQLTVVDDNMFGDYYCKAQNRLGTLMRVVSLEKGVKPPVPLAEVKHIKENELHLKLNSQGQTDMPITGFKVEYKRPGDEWEQYKEFKFGVPYVLDGLTPDSLYVIQVSSRNVAGYSDPSKEILQKTKKASPIKDQLSGASSITASLGFFLLLSLCHTIVS